MTPPRRKAAAAPADDGLPTVGHEDVILSNGRVFRLRGLTVGEVREALTAADDLEDVDAQAAIVAACTVEPKLTAERVAAWLKTAPAGDARRMADAAMGLCAMGEGATKSRVSAHRNRSAPGQ